MNYLKSIVFATILAVPTGVFAAGAHEDLACVGCHGIHTAKDGKVIFGVVPNTVDINPRTQKPYSGVTSLCLGCHQDSDKGGDDILPVAGHMSHPFNISEVNPKIAAVPQTLLRDGSFECVSCHDPHPSNPNYRYLRVATDEGSSMSKFCSVCHSAKVDPNNVNKDSLFNSMDQRKAVK